MAKEPKEARVAVRERLLEAADRLFYEQGVRAVGIDRILAEADAAKASLYAHFGCKDQLVAAYIERRIEGARAAIDAYVEAFPPEERAVRFFDFVIDWTTQAGFRGCPVQHLVGEFNDREHPARHLAVAQREWLIGRLTDWARAAGAADPQQLGGALVALFDGAIAAAEQDGPQRARDARWAAQRLLAH